VGAPSEPRYRAAAVEAGFAAQARFDDGTRRQERTTTETLSVPGSNPDNVVQSRKSRRRR
jgi:hypothetical protein